MKNWFGFGSFAVLFSGYILAPITPAWLPWVMLWVGFCMLVVAALLGFFQPPR
jgi:hypothetical protein